MKQSKVIKTKAVFARFAVTPLLVLGLCVTASAESKMDQPVKNHNAVGQTKPIKKSTRIRVINEQGFAIADSNKDALLSLNEFDNYVIALFSAADENRDRKLDPKESRTTRPEDLARLDLNLDKVLTFQEVMRSSHLNFKAADQNGDKKVSLDEVNGFAV
jgi:hypothetical protein